jgi:hypothetical protein
MYNLLFFAEKGMDVTVKLLSYKKYITRQDSVTNCIAKKNPVNNRLLLGTGRRN